MISARTRPLSATCPPSTALGLVLATATALSACGGGAGSGDTDKPQSTAIDAAVAAAGGAGASAVAADASASAASAVTAVTSQPARHIAAATGHGDTLATTTAKAATAAPAATIAFVAAPVATAQTTSFTTALALAPAPAPAATQTSSTTQSAAASALTASLSSTQVDSLLKTAGVMLPVRAATENWSAARTTLLNNSGWATWVNQKRAAVDHWFGKTRDRLDLVAGFPNDYVDLRTGAALTWSDDSVEPPAGTTDRERAFKAAWVAIMREVNIGYALDAARLYQLTGNTQLAELAASQLDFYADNYNKWPLRVAIGSSRMFGQTLEEATSVLQMLETARALAPYASATRKAKWRDGVFFPLATNLQTYAWGNLNNMNLWCAVATAAIGMEHGNTTWTDAGLTGPRSVAAVMTQGITQDGIWYEGSFAYNNYVLLGLARLFDLAVGAGRGDVVTKYAQSVQRMLLAPILYRFDDGSLPSPNDTRAAVAPIDKATHGALYRHVPTTYGVQYAAGIRSWASLMDPPPSNSTTPQLPAPQTVYSPDTGFASLRSGSWQVFIHYGQKTQAHAQAEALGYELANGTTNITRDAGTSNSYGSPEHLEYFSQGLGNNVPLVDGQGPEGANLGEVKSFDPLAGTLDVMQASYRSDASARRSYKVDTTGFTESTQLTLTKAGATPRRLGVVFNTTCGIQITDTRAGTAASVAAPTGAVGFKYWNAVTRQTAQSTWTAKLSCGAKSYEMTVTGPAGQQVYRATVPSTPLPSTRNSLYVETTGLSASFTTTIRPL
jgi:hypothetical protein